MGHKQLVDMEAFDAPVTTVQSTRAVKHSRADSLDVVRSGLNEVLGLLLRPEFEFAREFLFQRDQQADISCLTNPIARSYATLGKLVDIAKGPDGFEHESTAYVVHVPCVSVNSEPKGDEPGASVTVGVSVVVPNATDGMFAVLGSVNSGRWARDNRTGAVIDVLTPRDVVKTNALINVNVPISSTVFRHATTAINLRILEMGIRHGDRRLLEAAVALAMSCTFHRNCLKCEPFGRNSCQCQLSYHRPKHPLDFSSHVPNVLAMTGTFQCHHRSVFNRSLAPDNVGTMRDWWKRATHTRDTDTAELFTPVMTAHLTGIFDYTVNARESDPILRKGLDGLLRDVSLLSISPRKNGSSESDEEPALEIPQELRALSLLLDRDAPLGPSTTTLIAPDTPDTRDTPTGHSRSGVNVSSTSSDSVEVLDERAMRAAARKQRNRASAARSNAKRKRENDARKDALARVRAQRILLEEKRQMLLNENAELRERMLSELRIASIPESTARPSEAEDSPCHN